MAKVLAKVRKVDLVTGEIVDVDEEIEVTEEPVQAPTVISDRQFFQQLAVQGIISKEEALAAVKTGVIPGPLQALVDTLPEDQQFAAEMLISGATLFHRTNALVPAIGAALVPPMDAAGIDDFWCAASKL